MIKIIKETPTEKDEHGKTPKDYQQEGFVSRVQPKRTTEEQDIEDARGRL